MPTRKPSTKPKSKAIDEAAAFADQELRVLTILAECQYGATLDTILIHIPNKQAILSLVERKLLDARQLRVGARGRLRPEYVWQLTLSETGRNALQDMQRQRS